MDGVADGANDTYTGERDAGTTWEGNHMDVNDERGIDRRRLLGIGAAGLGAVGAAAAFGAPAAAEGGDSQGSQRDRPEAHPLTLGGTSLSGKSGNLDSHAIILYKRHRLIF